MKAIYTLFITILTLVFSATFFSYSSGPASVNGNGYTGAPGETFLCGGCHSGGPYGIPIVNVVVSLFGSPVTEYTPNAVHDVTVTIISPMGTPAAYGFQLVALNSDNTSAGTFDNPSSNMKISIGNSGRIYAEHNMRSLSNTFSFQWTAGGGLTGDVNFYAVGNSINSAQGTGGDNGSNTSTVIALREINLPIELISFKGQRDQFKVNLAWEVQEENITNYTIARSKDGSNFKTVGTVTARGTANEMLSYTYTDDRPQPGINYYRLQANEEDGTRSYSEVIAVKMPDIDREITIAPNPVLSTANLAFQVAEDDYTMTVYNNLGQVMERKLLDINSGFLTTDINTDDWTAGIYIIELRSEFEIYSERLLKQ